jgi:hypothetical protein
MALSPAQQRIARRDLLRGVAAATAAGAVVGLPALVLTARPDSSAPAVASAAAEPGPSGELPAGDPIVAYVRDAASGEVVIMSGTEELVIHDPDLVSRIVGAGRV